MIKFFLTVTPIPITRQVSHTSKFDTESKIFSTVQLFYFFLYIVCSDSMNGLERISSWWNSELFHRAFVIELHICATRYLDGLGARKQAQNQSRIGVLIWLTWTHQQVHSFCIHLYFLIASICRIQIYIGPVDQCAFNDHSSSSNNSTV